MSARDPTAIGRTIRSVHPRSCHEGRDQLVARAGIDPELDDGTRRYKPVCKQANSGELLGPPGAVGFDQHAAAPADFGAEKATERGVTCVAKASRALFANGWRDLRHPGSWRARPRRERKDVEIGEPG